jgi:Na+-driven multidrug efflux pump
MSTYNESLTQGSVARGLLKFAIPVLLSSVLQTVYSTTDLIIVGRFSSTADVSGVSTGAMTMGILTMAMVGLVMGVTVLIGHRAGARTRRASAVPRAPPSCFSPCSLPPP